eukprot:15366998-Ditylum_brightwellii.AAC.1
MEAYLKQHSCDPVALEPPRLEASLIQVGQAKQPRKYSLQEQSYVCDLERSDDNDVTMAMAMLTADDGIPCVKPSTAYKHQMEIKRFTDVTDSPTADKKRKLIHGDPHTDMNMEAYLKQHSCSAVTSEPPRLEASLIRGGQAKQLITCQDHRTTACTKVYPSYNTISNVSPTWPVIHGNKILESSNFSLDSKKGCISTQFEDKVDKDILQFLFDLVND